MHRERHCVVYFVLIGVAAAACYDRHPLASGSGTESGTGASSSTSSASDTASADSFDDSGTSASTSASSSGGDTNTASTTTMDPDPQTDVPIDPVRDVGAALPETCAGEALQPDMVCVAGGPYVQGCPQNCPPKPGWYALPDPADRIFLPYDPAYELPEFQIHTTEVTVASYSDCVDDDACPAVICEGANGNWPFDATTADHPANCMRTIDASAYCAWRGEQLGISMRVPTECEWEKAARGDADGRAYVGGDVPPGCVGGRVGGGTCDIIGTTEVGTSANDVSPYGVLDMMGNVSEITISQMRDGSPEWVTRGANFSTASLEQLELQMRVDFRYPSSYDGDVQQGAASFGFRCVAGPSYDEALDACPPQ